MVSGDPLTAAPINPSLDRLRHARSSIQRARILGFKPLPARRQSGISFAMMRAQNIFIVGPMGAGKSTVGRQLSESLSYTFKDSDQEIQRRTGVDIPTIFEFEGEEGFRNRERQVIEELVAEERIVLATGGGAILNPENRQNLSSRGVVIYLHCSPEQQYARTARDRNRPLLDTEDPLAKLREIMDEREPLYRQVADMVVSTEKRGTSSVVKEICRRLASEEI
jgi:shikimate kinase